MNTPDNDVWVFGYASLMWRPDFNHLEAQPARLFGYHRALCVYSYLYRGTRENPGLVAGLLPGGFCRGVAFRVAAQEWPQVHRFFWLIGRWSMTSIFQNGYWLKLGASDNRFLLHR